MEGEQRKAIFTYTLAASKSLFPQLDYDLPGLKKNEFFTALVKTNLNNSQILQIDDYKKL